MKRVLSSAVVMLMLGLGLQAQTAPDTDELTRLLKEFLAGASRNDAAVHERFWADDLIYTGSSGRRVGKADILRDLRAAPAPGPNDPKTIFTAEDIRIQQYGNTAIVAFRLVGTTDKDGKPQVAQFLNTGTFLKRNGVWQVVSWQATRMPRAEEEVRKEVAAIEAAFHQAIAASDVKKLAALVDESFVWMQRTGEQMTRQQWLDRLGAGQLKHAKPAADEVIVRVYGDTAVVRGVAPQQRSSPAASGSGASPVTAVYSLTLINKNGDWKVVAMHTSQP